jgi:hypothetical protein
MILILFSISVDFVKKINIDVIYIPPTLLPSCPAFIPFSQ